MKVRLACASLVIAFAGASCTTTDYTGEKEVSTATMGAVGGAVAGAVLGNQVKGNKNTRQNARIAGAAIGAAAGGAIGNHFDKKANELVTKMNAAGVTARREGKNIFLSLPGDIGFETGRSDLSGEAQGLLGPVSDVLNDKEFKESVKEITIAGHTDSRGNLQANNTLSEQRANSVKNFFKSRGMDEKRMSTVGYGPSQPVGDNKTPDGQKLNRRVTITIAPIPG